MALVLFAHMHGFMFACLCFCCCAANWIQVLDSSISNISMADGDGLSADDAKWITQQLIKAANRVLKCAAMCANKTVQPAP